MRKSKLSYRYIRERNFSQLTQDEEGINTNANGVTFFNSGAVDAFLQINSVVVPLVVGASFSFENESPHVMEGTVIEKIYFKEGQIGEKRVTIIKSVIKPFTLAETDGLLQ